MNREQPTPYPTLYYNETKTKVQVYRCVYIHYVGVYYTEVNRIPSIDIINIYTYMAFIYITCYFGHIKFTSHALIELVISCEDDTDICNIMTCNVMVFHFRMYIYTL